MDTKYGIVDDQASQLVVRILSVQLGLATCSSSDGVEYYRRLERRSAEFSFRFCMVFILGWTVHVEKVKEENGRRVY